ncbi:sodium:solute symporter family protein [Pelagicoccus sp. SDUM812005]|uniref:sodium:solute symporter family protein n=1 Tax=Pelagicoccus sp. SDUM812005 TaxID=3041257 RepID=UPI00280F3ADC|nr:sodium:solute symporter family protein [Pelagicoccus sp. SDUM812005]MDQ8182575.1 Na+:solute symporter [Pelagicoccus sp. SDUM812005]
MDTLDYVTLIVFTLGVFAAGMSFSKSGKNLKTFFAGGGAVPWWISGLSLFMSFFSAGTFVAWGSLAYIHGWVAISVQWTMCIGGFAVAGFVAARWRRTGVLTGAEFIGKRLGHRVKKIYSYLFLGLSAFTGGAFLYPVAKIVEAATGFPFEYTVIGLGLGIMLYTSVGGLWAVIVTDVLQFVILAAAVVIIVPLAFDKIGGFEAFTSQAPEGFFSLTTDEYTPLFLIGFGLYNFFYLAGNWAYVQRYTSVKTPAESRKVALLFGSLYTLSPVVWMLPPMIYRIYNPGLDIAAGEANHAYMYIAKEVLPSGMLGLIVGAMVFATASSLNTTLNIVSGVFTSDIYRSLRSGATDKQLMFVARASTVVFGLFMLMVALSVDRMGGILNVIWAVGGITGGAMLVPPLWSLFSKRQTGKTVLSVTLICLAVNCFFKFNGAIVLNQAQTQVLGAGLPLVLMALVEIALSRRGPSSDAFEAYERERLQAIDKLSGFEQRDEDLEAKRENKHGITVIAIGVTAIGCLIVCFGFLAEDGQWLIGTIGTVVAVVGASILKSVRSIAKA